MFVVCRSGNRTRADEHEDNAGGVVVLRGGSLLVRRKFVVGFRVVVWGRKRWCRAGGMMGGGLRAFNDGGTDCGGVVCRRLGDFA